jgi:hypothetical protein
MKRAAAFFYFLACSGLLLADSPDPGRSLREPAPLLEELARLTKAGFSDETVLIYAKAHRAEAPSLIAADDLLWLRESGVSEAVTRYMTAIDVRVSDQGGEEDVAYESAEAAVYPSAAYSYPDYSYYGYPEDNSYVYGGYPETYYADYYPFFGAGYYPYPVYFFVNNAGFFGRFHGRGYRFGSHRGRFNDHGRFGHPRLPRGGLGRGTGGRRGGMTVGHRGLASPGFQRRSFGPGSVPRRSSGPGFVGPRGGVSGHGGIGRPVITRGGFGHGSRSPQAIASRGAPGRPALAGGSRVGGGFGRGPTPSFRGAPRPVGRSGGRIGR